MLNGKKTYDDYFKDRDKKNNNIQSRSNPTSRMFERNTSGVLATNTDYGNSDYDKKLNWGADINPNNIQRSLNENRSEQQGGWAEAGAFGGRVINKVGLEVAKTAGAIVGTVGGLVGNTVDLLTGQDNTDFLQTAFNNDFIKAAEKISKSINKEYLPVYVSDTVTNGSFLDKVTSGEFWATDGADGVGYLISAMGPGAAFKALGGANKLFGGATKAAKFLNYGEGIEGARKTLLNAGMTIDKINDYAIPAINTYFEAGAESKGVSNDLDARKPEFLANYQNQQLKKLQELDIRRRKGEINIDEYNKLSENIGNKTAEDAFLEQKSKATRNTFLTNIGILAIPNYIQAKLVFGKNPSNILLDKITGKVADKTIKNTIKQAGKRIGQSFLSEGSEEVAQTSTEKRNVDKAIKGELSNTYVQDINPYTFGEDFVKSLGTTEGQVAGFLGGMLGSPISIVQGYRQDNADRTRTEKLRTKINGSSSALQDIYNTPLYETEEYTNPETDQVSTRDKEVNGKKVFIPENVAKVKNALDFQEQLSKIYDKAVEEGDTETLESLKKQGEFNIISNYIGEDVVTLDALNEHLKVIFPTTENNENGSVLTQEQVKKNTENKERITNVIDKARVLQKDLVSFKDMSSSIIKLKNPEASKEQIIDFLNNLGNAFISERSEEYDLKQKYKELKLKQQALKKDQTTENIENVDFIQGKTEDIYKEKKIINNPRLDFINKQIKQVEEELQNFNETTNALIWDNEFLNKQLNNKIEASKRLKEATSEEKVQETDDIITNIKSATTVEDLDNIKPNEYTAEQFNKKREELESYKTNEREQEVSEKTADTNVRQVLKSKREELTDDMTFEKYYKFEGDFIKFVNKDSNDNLLYEKESGEQILFVDKITKQEETTVDDIVEGSANDFKVVDPKPVANVDENGESSSDGKSPGSVKNNKQYKDYLLESRDKKGDVVTFSVNKTAGKNYNSFYDTYDKFLKTGELSNKERQELIDNLPITFHYNNGSSSFSSHGKTLNKELRISIINHLKKGVTLENLQSVVVNQTNADFNNQIVDNKPAVNNVLNITEFNRDTKNLVLYHINTEGKFIVVSEKQEDFQGSHKVNQDLS